MNNRHLLISKHGSIKKADEADSAIAKQILARDDRAGERGVRSRKRKSFLRGIATPLQNIPQMQRHAIRFHDARPAWPPRLRETFALVLKMRAGEEVSPRQFRNPNPVYPFCK